MKKKKNQKNYEIRQCSKSEKVGNRKKYEFIKSRKTNKQEIKKQRIRKSRKSEKK